MKIQILKLQGSVNEHVRPNKGSENEVEGSSKVQEMKKGNSPSVRAIQGFQPIKAETPSTSVNEHPYNYQGTEAITGTLK